MAPRGSGPDAGEVYRSLAPAVLGYLRAHRVPDAEDVLGEVFVQVARDIHRVHGDHLAVRKWVFTIARHRVIDAARARGRRVAIADVALPDRPSLVGGVDDPLDPELIAALSGLTLEQREVLVLRFVADLPLEAVARMTRRRVGAVKALQHRALAQLAAVLSRADVVVMDQAVSPEPRPTL